MTLELLLQPWNLLFILPFLAGLLYAGLLATGVVAAEHDSDADGAVGGDAGGVGDADAGFDHDVPHAADTAFGHDPDAHPSGQAASGLLQALSFLGVGRVPLSIVAVSFLVLFGFLGWASNQLLGAAAVASPLGWISLVVALVGATLVTRNLSLLLARILPSTETYGVSTHELVGRAARVSERVTRTFGVAQVHDDHGYLHQVECRIEDGQEPIEKGSEVLLARFDADKRVFSVLTNRQLDEQLERLRLKAEEPQGRAPKNTSRPQAIESKDERDDHERSAQHAAQ